MRKVMRPRYYCDHCKKGNGSPSAMKRHEAGCTANPHRVCGMCKLVEEQEGELPAPPRDELVRIMDSLGFKAMREAANECPACILSALRTKNVMDDDIGPHVSGPEDGRETWSFKKAKDLWWDSFRTGQFDRENP